MAKPLRPIFLALIVVPPLLRPCAAMGAMEMGGERITFPSLSSGTYLPAVNPHVVHVFTSKWILSDCPFKSNR